MLPGDHYPRAAPPAVLPEFSFSEEDKELLGEEGVRLVAVNLTAACCLGCKADLGTSARAVIGDRTGDGRGVLLSA